MNAEKFKARLREMVLTEIGRMYAGDWMKHASQFAWLGEEVAPTQTSAIGYEVPQEPKEEP